MELSSQRISFQIIKDGHVYFIDEGDPEFEYPFCGANMWFNERVNVTSQILN